MYTTWEAELIDLGWTVEDIGALSDEVKAFAQESFNARYAEEETETDPNLPPPIVADATVAAAAVPVAQPVTAASIAAHTDAQIKASRTAQTAELQRVEACRSKCPSTSLVASLKLNADGKLDDAGTVKKVNVLQQAIGHGWTPAETELVVVRASRATAGQHGIAQGTGDDDKTPVQRAQERADKFADKVLARMGRK